MGKAFEGPREARVGSLRLLHLWDLQLKLGCSLLSLLSLFHFPPVATSGRSGRDNGNILENARNLLKL